MKHQPIQWREAIPWVALLVVLSCAGARTAAPAAPSAVDRQRVRTLETEEIILTGKDGKPRGKLSAEGLTLADDAGNTISVALGTSAKIDLHGAGNAYHVGLEALADGASLSVAGGGNTARLEVDPTAGAMLVSSGKREIHAAVEANRPLADVEVFDADGKRRASFGLNSNGQPRLSLYDATELRRIYGIVNEDGTALLDLNDKTGEAAVQLLGVEPTLGSGLTVFHGPKPVVQLGVDPAGKPLR